MNFNKHFQLEGKHALLSASSWRWLYDDEESLIKRIRSQYSTDIGTILHNVAYKHIKYQIKMNKYDKKNVMLELLSNGIPGYVVDALDFDSMYENLMTYVNDCVGFRMKPEVVLYYSNNFFGTADAIKFDEKEKFLRIHDYKSGVTPAHMEQLLIYAALFCLEYRIKPSEIEVELRIYQNNQIVVHNPAPDEITNVMRTIEKREKFLTDVNGGA
jgi:hypothetical protein